MLLHDMVCSILDAECLSCDNFSKLHAHTGVYVAAKYLAESLACLYRDAKATS